MRAGNSSSGSGVGSVMGEVVTVGNSLETAGGVSALPLMTPFTSGTGAALDGGLLRVFSGTFSFCAVVSTELPTAAVPPSVVDTDAEESVGFFCFFFLLDFVEGRSVLGGGLEEVEVAVGGLPFPALTVSREEISNMVGTERNSCCVIPPLSSSERGGEW